MKSRGEADPLIGRTAKASGETGLQGRLLAFLLNPRSYPHRPRNVRLIQTHSSFVFVVAPLVYKVKKPVNFGFLNFSTLEKRRYYCEREVELNQRLSPKMYLGVVPIAQTDGGFAFGQGERVVEYAVKMRKLSERYFLDHLIERHEVRLEDLDRIVCALRTFYLSQDPTQEIEAWGRIDRLQISTDENFRQAEPFIGRTLSRPTFEAIRAYAGGFYDRGAARFKARIQQKWIRDCHGDLHLGHIHLTPRTLHIYDCIEFNDRLRYVDVANDIAFLSMDLDYAGRPDLSHHFVARMTAALHDPGMLSVLDFYKCYRAFVRGKVESLHSAAPEAPDAERQESARQARRYFRLALQYAVSGSQPLALVLMGPIGSGKTTLAGALSEELGWLVVSSDRLRKEMAGFPLYERSPRQARARLYSAAMTTATYRKLFDLAEARLAEGRGVILDATFARREHRSRLRARLVRRRMRCRFLELQADEASVRRRLKNRDSSENAVSDARIEDFQKLTRIYQPPGELSAEDRFTLDTTGPLPETVQRVLTILTEAQLESLA